MITVFTSCYNQAQYLGQCIESVLGQSYQDFEYHIYDDNSTDYTRDVMEYYWDAHPNIVMHYGLKHMRPDNVGKLAAESQKRMKGDYWVWAPADDMLMPDLLAEKHYYAEHGLGDVVLYNDSQLVDQFCRNAGSWKWNKTAAEFAADIWSCEGIGMTGIWIPKIVFDKTGFFPTHLEFSEDFYWMVKAVIDKVDFVPIQKCLSLKRVTAASTSEVNFDKLGEQIEKIRDELKKYVLLRGIFGTKYEHKHRGY